MDQFSSLEVLCKLLRMKAPFSIMLHPLRFQYIGIVNILIQDSALWARIGLEKCGCSRKHNFRFAAIVGIFPHLFYHALCNGMGR